MPSDLRFVLDTNVIISALLIKQSVTRRAFDKAFESGKLLISTSIGIELNDILRRSAFNKYIIEEERIQFLIDFLKVAEFIDIIETVRECRDPKDNKFLELAINGKATCIISGDKDLLILHPFRGIPILTPHAFLNYSLEMG